MNGRMQALALVLVLTGMAAPGEPGSSRGGPEGARGGRPGDAGGPPPRALMDLFFPPELVMRHQRAIGLTADQQTAIKNEMQQSMARFTELVWQQSAEEEALTDLAAQDRGDEKQVLAQFDRLLRIENEIKRLHMTTLVRVKNVLTPAQQATLRELRQQGESGPQRPKRGSESRPAPPPPD
jgi:Spy/CpxP family protein refolding chaperone